LGAASENAFRNGREEEAAAAYGSAIARIARPIGLVWRCAPSARLVLPALRRGGNAAGPPDARGRSRPL